MKDLLEMGIFSKRRRTWTLHNFLILPILKNREAHPAPSNQVKGKPDVETRKQGLVSTV